MRMEKISVRYCVDLGFNDLSINIGRASPSKLKTKIILKIKEPIWCLINFLLNFCFNFERSDPSVLSLVGLGRTLNPP